MVKPHLRTERSRLTTGAGTGAVSVQALSSVLTVQAQERGVGADMNTQANVPWARAGSSG